MECLLRPYEVRSTSLQMPDLGYPVSDAQNTDEAHKSQELGGTSIPYKPAIGEMTIYRKSVPGWQSKLRAARASKRSQQQQGSESKRGSNQEDAGSSTEETGLAKKAKTDANPTCAGDAKSEANSFLNEPSYMVKSCISPNTITGHTGYLVFATFFPCC